METVSNITSDVAFQFREIRAGEFELMRKWFAMAGEVPPDAEDIPETTYCVALRETPIVFISVILTNTRVMWLDNFVANPDLKGPFRRIASGYLVEQVEKEAREKGFKKGFCMALNAKLSNYYQSLGYRSTAWGVFTHIKEI